MTDRPRVISDSRMWQSRTWSQLVDSVYRFEAGRSFVNWRPLIALRLLLQRHRYSAVMTTGNQTSLYYGLLCRLLLLDSRQVVTQLYLDERRGLLRWLHDPLMRWVLAAARGVIVPSRGEVESVVERFGVPRNRIRFVPFHTNLTAPIDLGCGEGYLFAGGRNFRDYDTLVEAASDLDAELVIVCGADHLRDRPLPPNVRVYRDVAWSEYIALLHGACGVVVPLSSATVPAGQVAILEGMGYGKPVVTTRSVGTADYVRPEVDGLVYALGDVDELRVQLRRLVEDRNLRTRLGHAAFEAATTWFTFERHVANKLRALADLGGFEAAPSCSSGRMEADAM
ncbi:MAG: glycosyltransferase [Dehalococcoidia bacterium]